ncbi:hypothetical protein MSG28_007108 [Choristoneura fumiferana]|uniref:Uncharacterized protein n=1 Tax=Choristoneura fumiferana TaxID=7141 RepID=A0ACC0JMH0_CHOFU|nr:hypothetical protein MSG28_007108 [Choristoneura fumiferana]
MLISYRPININKAIVLIFYDERLHDLYSMGDGPRGGQQWRRALLSIPDLIQQVPLSGKLKPVDRLSGSVAIICIIGLRISIVEPGSMQFISMLNYMMTMLSQLFLYCWCGNQLTIRSELLRDVMYLSPWYEQSNPFRRLLWVAMERMKRPILFKAGHYIPLSRPTFVLILRSSYSYFAVLNQAQHKDK